MMISWSGRGWRGFEVLGVDFFWLPLNMGHEELEERLIRRVVDKEIFEPIPQGGARATGPDGVGWLILFIAAIGFLPWYFRLKRRRYAEYWNIKTSYFYSQTNR